MTFDINNDVIFLPDTQGRGLSFIDQQRILRIIQVTYNNSDKAKSIIEKWGQKITITFQEGQFNAGTPNLYKTPQGKIYIDPSFLNDLSYINDKGKAIPYTLFGALVHELVHAVTGLEDNIKIGNAMTGSAGNFTTSDYQGDTVRLTNTIWEELRSKISFLNPDSINIISAGLDKEISYLGKAANTPPEQFGELQKIGYDYTNGKQIDTAVNVDAFYVGTEETRKLPRNWNTSELLNSKDLLIGGPGANKLESGAGDDFLFGGGGNDTLNGGTGKDTAVYVGSRSEYDIKKNQDGSFSISNKGNSQGAGTDKMIDIEFAQFDGLFFQKEIVDLKKIVQKNITFVIDKTTNTEIFVDIETNVAKPVLTDIVYSESFDEVTTVVSSQVEYTKSVVSSLINAAFADENNDVEIGIVTFNDTKIGNPSQVILPFTNQDNFADRKAAALAAINSVTASDGGDIPETPFDGLKLALSGSIGEWRLGAGTRQIFLFTDAPAKDYELAAEVTALAQNIGATITGSTAVALAGGAVNTFNLAFSSKTANFSGLTGSTDPNVAPVSISQMAAAEPIDPNPTTAQVQIFTIFTGNAATDTSALAKIANDNGGAFLAGLSSEDLVKRLSEIVNPAPIIQTPTISIFASDPNAAETKSGEIANPGQLLLNRTGDLTQSLTVAYTLAGTATNGTDYQTLASTVTFAPGKDTAMIDLTTIDDNISEGNEDITITLADGGNNYKLSSTDLTATVTITDNETKPLISIANVTQIEGNSGINNYAFNLTLNKPSTETVTVKYTTADGTATAVSDYTAATGTVIFNPGETSKTVNISVKGDTTLELDETFTVNLTDAVGGTIGKATGTGTIIDDDRPVIALTTPDANASEDKKDPGLFNLARTGSAAQALTVSYTIAGTATNDADYKKLTGTATFKAGQSQTSIEIKPSNDKIYEGSETVVLTLNDGGINYKFDPIANTGTVTITDEDLPSISLSVTDDKAAETKIGEAVNPGQLTLKRTGITTDALTVSYTIDGSASNGIDYQKLENSVTFVAGSDTAIINIRPIDDQFAEGTETVKLKLADNSNYTINGEKSGTVKIADNDNPRDRDAKDLVLKVENLDESKPRIGTGLQGGLEGEVIDLRSFGGQTLKVDTISVSDASYQNYIGFYAVEDAQGTLANGLKVSDSGYAEAAIKSVILRSYQHQTQSDLSVTGGKIFAPVVIANGTFEEYLNRNPQNQASSNIHAYFNYIGANTDKVDHFKLLGDNKFGVEDTYGGGDKDYNDLVFQMTVKI
jgi:Calx-beta domain/Domain of unknown function (DUF4114)/RTX calcium-binding nonapeptide repeat (4 copies)